MYLIIFIIMYAILILSNTEKNNKITKNVPANLSPLRGFYTLHD